MAKGARGKRSNLKGALQPFTPLLLKWSGNGSMKTLRQAEPISLGLPLSGVYLYSAMYINELVDRVLMPEVASPDYSMIICLRSLNWRKAPIPSPRCAALNSPYLPRWGTA